MDRRKFIQIMSALAGAFSLGACDDKSSGAGKGLPDVVQEPFSRETFQKKLESLRNAFEAKDRKVSGTLLPPVSESELIERCHWFPGKITPELSALYGWHEGQEKGAWETKHPFWFRDNAFCRLSIAQDEYKSMMSSYGIFFGDRALLKHSFPFAAFNGGWFVLPTNGHPFDSQLQRPVISVMEGIDVYFYSMQSMVDTCIEWVSHPDYDKDGMLPDGVELEIWRKHNPGIFSS